MGSNPTRVTLLRPLARVLMASGSELSPRLCARRKVSSRKRVGGSGVLMCVCVCVRSETQNVKTHASIRNGANTQKRRTRSLARSLAGRRVLGGLGLGAALLDMCVV